MPDGMVIGSILPVSAAEFRNVRTASGEGIPKHNFFWGAITNAVRILEMVEARFNCKLRNSTRFGVVSAPAMLIFYAF